MLSRFFALGLALVALLAIQPLWIRLPTADFGSWVVATPPEEVAAAGLRAVAIVLVSIQLFGMGLVAVGNAVGSGGLERLGRRLVLPALRTMIPLAVVAGPATPALATIDPGVVPPAVTATLAQPDTPHSVIVEAGDSMWKIAEVHAPHRVAPYWIEMVELNRHRFDDVDLIHPGDTVLLPSGEDAHPNLSHGVVDVGVDENDRLPGPEGEGTVDDRDDDGGSDPGGENMIPPVPRRTVPMLPPLLGG